MSADSHIAPARREHYPILDALRFVLATWVVTSHYGMPPLFAGADPSNRFVWLLMRGWSTFTYGVPAVIGFFVISGFCIHLPFRHDEELPVGRYYARRYIRILVPVVAMLSISRVAGSREPIFGTHSILWESVLWSLLCEEIYYAAYPGLRFIRKRFGWPVILSVSFLLAAPTAIIYRHNPTWTTIGPLKTALILYPIWLLGCVLAEQSESLMPIDSAATIWKWRFVAWVGSWVCEMLNFHFRVPYTQTMLWFGILAYFWIRNEIAYGKRHRPSGLLVFGGAWSYSLYLFHEPAMRILWRLHVPNFGYLIGWLVAFGLTLGFSYLFYLLIEKPSHRLARAFHVIGKQSLQKQLARPVQQAELDAAPETNRA